MRASLVRAARVALVAGLACSSILGVSSAAHAEPAPDRFALGDSVMLGAKDRLKALGFGIVDAVESRQSYSGPAELRHRGTTLPRNVVIHLGTNGSFPLAVCKAMVNTAGPARRVFLLTVHVDRSWTAPNNRVIRECAAAYPKGRVTVIDWDWAATRHPQWLYSDGTHLRPKGAEAYARLIDEAITAASAT